MALAINECCGMTGTLQSAEEQNDINIIVPENQDTELLQNVPNPFKEATTISFTLSCDCRATIKIYNASGQWIETLMNESRGVGQHSIQWIPQNIAPGMYFYSLEVDGVEQVRRAVKM